MRKIALINLLLFINIAFAQECLNDITSLKFSEGFPFGHLVVQSNQNFSDPYLVKWYIDKISGDPIYLLDFDTEYYIPPELYGYENDINSLFSQAISSWNNNYSLQLEIDNYQDGILFGFAENEELFIDPVSGGVASARIHLPVVWNILGQYYECYEYAEQLPYLTEFYGGFVYFNSSDESGISWTTSTSPDGNDMLGTVILHEMGHVLSLGHSTYILGEPRIMDKMYDASTVVPSLTDCDISNASYHYSQLYENTGNTYLYNEGLVEFIPQPNAYGEDTEIHMVLKSDHTTRYNIYFNFTKATDPNSADFEPHDVTTSYCQYLAWQGSTLRRTLREPGYWYYYKAAFYNGISFEGQTEGIYYCNVTVGVEDGIYFEPLLSSYQTNTYYYSGSAYYRNFIDQAPQGDYIVSWDNWKCYANNGYEDVLIMDSQSFNIPTLPDGFNWERDSNGNVIATMTTGGIDNDGHHHTSSREIKISGVPNNFVTSGTIPVNTTWCGDITITGDIIVPVGKQLTVLLNTHITFTNGSSLIVEGNLVFENHDFRMSVLDFQSQNATLKNGIKVNAGGTANINNAVVKNAYNGVYVDEGVVNIDNSEIFDCYYGIHLYRTNYVSYPDSYIENTHSHDNEFGVVMYYSTAHLSNNEFNNNWRGVGCADYSSPFLAPNDNNSESNGYNYIHNNDIGVFAYGYSNPFLGRETCVSFGGNNTIVNNNDYEFFTHSNCNVSAENNYWGGGAPVRYVGSGCSFDYTPYLTSAPQQSQSTVASPEEEVFDIQFESQLSKANNSADVVSLSKSSITSGFNKSWSIEWKLLYARNLMRVKKYNEAATICEDVITNYPDSSFSYLALDLLHQSRIKSRSKSLFLQFVEEKAKLKTEKQIYGLAELLLVVGEKENRVSILNGIMDKYKDTPLVEFVLFQKFMYYLYEENNLELAKTTSETLGKLFPNSESYYDSRRQLGEDVGIHLQPQLTKNTPNEETVELPKTYELHGNYPNPFNPSTTISYSLAFNSNVEITIFEITGKVVKVFSENVQSAGYRNIVWNGNNQQGAKVSSGIYFYRFKAISLENEAVFEKTAKMLLLK